MFGAIVDRWKSKRAAEELLKNPAIALARGAIHQIWGAPAVSGEFSPEFVQTHGQGMMQRCIEIATAADPVAKCRDYLSGAAQESAQLELVVLSGPKVEDVNDFRKLPGVSGALWPHLMTIARTNATIQELVQGMPEPATTPNEVHDICLWRHRIVHSHMSVYNVMRTHFGDKHVTLERDWFRPFYRCCLMWYEASIREAAALPELIEPTDALEYHAMIAYVDAGVRYPNLTWEEDMGRPIP